MHAKSNSLGRCALLTKTFFTKRNMLKEQLAGEENLVGYCLCYYSIGSMVKLGHEFSLSYKLQIQETKHSPRSQQNGEQNDMKWLLFAAKLDKHELLQDTNSETLE